MMNLYQERDFGQVINATVEFIRLNLRPLARCLLLVALPVTLGLTLVSQLLVRSGLSQFTPGGLLANHGQMLGWAYWAGIGLSLVTHVVQFGTVYAYMLDYEAGNTDIRPAHIWPRLLRNAGPMLLALIVAGLLCGLSMFAFFLPLGWMLVSFSLLLMVQMREQTSPTHSPFRSFELLASPWWSAVTASPFLFWLLFFKSIREQVANFWTTLALVGIATFVSLPLLTLVSLPALLMGMSDGIFNTKTMMSQQAQPVVIALSLLTTIISTFVGAILPIALGFQYYNLLDRREGGGILALVDTIGQETVRAEEPNPRMAQLRTDDEGDY